MTAPAPETPVFTGSPAKVIDNAVVEARSKKGCELRFRLIDSEPGLNIDYQIGDARWRRLQLIEPEAFEPVRSQLLAIGQISDDTTIIGPKFTYNPREGDKFSAQVIVPDSPGARVVHLLMFPG